MQLIGEEEALKGYSSVLRTDGYPAYAALPDAKPSPSRPPFALSQYRRNIRDNLKKQSKINIKKITV
jgi:hypothetical protein